MHGKIGKGIANKVIFIFLCIWAVIQFFPVYWMFTFSLIDNNEIFGENIIGLPNVWRWDNYTAALKVGNIGKNFLNNLL